MLVSGSATEAQRFLPSIQGLRAVAVVSVVAYHVWPQALPGGFVGVDVFFVISGFLISRLLLRELHETGRISLTRFYARRARRLLPAAILVLFVVLLGLPALPASQWQDIALEVAASAVYLENWLLARQAVDYLGAENAASPVQHYWTLSIEEQFYVVWPVVILVAGLVAIQTDRRNAPSTLFWVLLPVVLGSLLASIILTTENPESAFFVTHTRIWELGLGGLLALREREFLNARLSEFVRILGLCAILVSGAMFSENINFPGYAAILPTMGAALVIMAGDKAPAWSTYAPLKSKPAQYLGDISYSVYLWHWPVHVYCSALFWDDPSIAQGILVVSVTGILSHATKIFVEDRFRYRADFDRNPAKAITFGAIAVGSCTTAAAGIYLVIAAQFYTMETTTISRLYPGAAAILYGAPVPPVSGVRPRLVTVKRDVPEAYRRNCHIGGSRIEPLPCEYGNSNANFHMVLVGDSHAASWIPALSTIVSARGWRLTTHTRSGCPLLLKSAVIERSTEGENCLEWGERVLEQLRDAKADVVVLTQAARQRIFQSNASKTDSYRVAAAIIDVWHRLQQMDLRVIAIADVPWMPFDPTECLAMGRSCSVDRKLLTDPDPILLAHARNPQLAGLIKMMDGLCTDSECPAVIGNVIVWRDAHHLTATYSKTLAPALESRINRLLAANQ